MRMDSRGEPKEYPLPFSERAIFKWYIHLGFLLMVGILAVFLFLPLGGKVTPLLRLFDLLCLAVILYAWVTEGLLRKTTLSLTEEFVQLKTPWGTKLARWQELYSVEVFSQSRNTFLGLVLTEKLKRHKPSFLNLLRDMFGGRYVIRIGLSTFPNLELGRLYPTINSQIMEHSSPSELKELVKQSARAKEAEGISLPMVLLKLALFSLMVGVVYGTSSYAFRSNIWPIALLGLFIMIYYYHLNVKERGLLPRFILGLLGALPVYIGVIVHALFSLKLPPSYTNFSRLTAGFFYNLLNHPLQFHIITVLLILAFFLLGVSITLNSSSNLFSKISMKDKTNN